MKRITTKAKFERWLKRQPLRTQFTQCRAGKCPLAKYSASYVDYGKQYTEYRNPQEGDSRLRISLPPWAERYVARFDDLDRSDPGFIKSVFFYLPTRNAHVFNKRGALFALRYFR